MMTSTCDILLLTSAFGMGHNSVANAIREQLLLEDSNIKIRIEDIMNISAPKTKALYFGFYRLITRTSPSLYNVLYNIKKNNPNNFMDEIVYDIFLKRVGEFILEVNPKVIISTFPLGSGFVSRVKEKYGLNIPLITAITDVVDSWEWIHDNTDLYFVPCKIVEERLIKKGIDIEKIRITGIPVKQDFLSRKDKDKDKGDERQVLIMGGAMKKVTLTKEMLQHLDRMENIRIVVVTGNDSDLYKKLKHYGPFKNIEIFGFSNEIARMMDESDVIVTKPGGATLFEAINKGVPLVLKRSKVGQEEENLRFIEEKGLGVLVEKNDDLETIIIRTLFDDAKLDRFEKNLEEVRTEFEADKIAEYVFDLL
jgi:processive 1,2-diacylglycerol beta-glucosyltransferase